MIAAQLLLGLLFGLVGYREAKRDAERFGRKLWGMDPLLWGAICFLSLVVGAILLVVARRGAQKRPAPQGDAVPATHAWGAAVPVAQALATFPAAQPAVAAAPAAPVPGQWAADPSGRHQYRWWDGEVWTAHVSSHGQTGVDPI